MSAARLPWFKCNPAKLLGGLAGLSTDEGYIYVMVLMRIYEVGGPIDDLPRALARRAGMTEKRGMIALQSLVEMGKISFIDGVIDSHLTHETLAEVEGFRDRQSSAAKIGRKKQAEKSKQNQQNDPAAAAPSLSHIRQETEDKETNELRSLVSASANAPAGGEEQGKPESLFGEEGKPKAAPLAKAPKAKVEKTLMTETLQPTAADIEIADLVGLDKTAFRFHWAAFRAHFIETQEMRPGWTRSWRAWTANIRADRKLMDPQSSVNIVKFTGQQSFINPKQQRMAETKAVLDASRAMLANMTDEEYNSIA